MNQSDFEKTARAMLDRFAIRSSGPLATAKDLENILQGSGYELERLELYKGRLPSTEDVAGGMLFADGASLAVFSIDEKGMPVLEGSKKGAVADLQKYTHALVLKRKPLKPDDIFHFIMKYRRRFADLLVCALIINFFALVFPLFSSFVYDKVLGNGIVETLWAVAICLLIVMAVEFCMRIIRVNAAERFAIASETDIDYGIFRRLLEAQSSKVPAIASFIEKYKQILSYRDFLSSSYLLSVADVPFTVLFLITIAAIGGPIVFIAVLCGCLMTAINAAFIAPVLHYDSVSKRGSEKRFGLMTDLLLAREVVIGSAFQKDLQHKLQQASIESAAASSRSRYWRGFGQSVSSSISYLSYVAVIVAGVYLVESHDMTPGGLLAVSMLTSRAMSSMSSVSNLILRYREFKVALRELNAILPAADIKNVPAPRGKLRGIVHFDGVTTTLKTGQNPVLENISFQISSGEIVGIAGAPGSGKTTLLRLITGAVTADKGTIMIDNIPVHRLSPEDVTLTIGYKPQDLCLLEGSVEDNIRAGRKILNNQQREEILEWSGLGSAFREGKIDWETQVGMRGASISGGQRQLVSIARAMLGNPSLLLLDEPTNGLDAQLEMHLARQIAGLRGKTTVLVSSHSHALLSVCDRIIAIGQSRILADGPREKVLAPATPRVISSAPQN